MFNWIANILLTGRSLTGCQLPGDGSQAGVITVQPISCQPLSKVGIIFTSYSLI